MVDMASQDISVPPESDSTGFVNRLEFYACDPESEILINLRKQIPEGHRIQSINEQLLERCEWRTEMEFYAGSMSNFLTHGTGLCLMRGNEIVVVAYASALGKTTAEIGAITHTTERGHGLAAIACAYLIEVCRQRGYQAYWSCDADHTASNRVAQKLGF